MGIILKVNLPYQFHYQECACHFILECLITPFDGLILQEFKGQKTLPRLCSI